MSQETLSLSWKQFPSRLVDTFQDLVREGIFSDVTLVCDDQIPIPAHKIIISACSPVFKNILLTNPHSHPLIYLRGVRQKVLQSILQFMYHGEVAISKESLQEFMNTAKDFQVEEISCDIATANDLVNNVETEIVKIEEVTHNKQVDGNDVDNLSNVNILEDTERSDMNLVHFDQVFHCQDCKLDFINEADLLLHNMTHYELVVYPCNQCEYSSTQQDLLEEHQQSMHGNVQYSCNQCDIKFTYKSSLKKHKSIKHEGVRYPCNQCKYQATSKENLTKHFQSLH